MSRKSDNNLSDSLAARMRKVAGAAALQQPTYSTATGEKRPARKPSFKAATLTLIGGERLDVIVKNVSETGARIEFLPEIRLTDRVLLSEPTLRIRTWAYVAWQTRGAAGLEFVKS